MDHNITTKIDDGLFPVKEVAFKNIWIYNCIVYCEGRLNHIGNAQ